MKATPKLSYLSDIRPYKPEWWVQVKVLHTWKQHSKFSETTEIIFADKKHLPKKNYLLSLGAECRVGEWKNLENFVITPAGGGYRPTNHPYKLSNIDMFLDLVEFETILSGHLDNNLLIAIDIGEKLTLQCSNGKEKKKIEFTLRDIKFKCDTANMSIVESNDSNNQMVRHQNKVINIDTWDQYDDKNVAELLTSTQVYYNLYVSPL
ncbi:hypothetical protein Bca52824_086879 [Brassica carinata]|uniref:Replication protein A 70 kDa DNA-binding subunit B/D first OB fold domain-containing protein n=1 Tax=Brassica carinata TaxID=52824 RepID=A0A8X7TPC1_BRACI|nr:hypothetical protein Bca52824_086879 [Brassica carinata]